MGALVLSTVLSGLAVAGAGLREGAPFPRTAILYGAGIVPTAGEQDIIEVSRYDLVVGGIHAEWDNPDSRVQLAGVVAKLKARNPHLTTLGYLPACYVFTQAYPRFPRAVALHTPEGRVINGWPGSWMIDLSKPAAVRWLQGAAIELVRERGFDGIFLDCMSPVFDAWAVESGTGLGYSVDLDQDGKPDTTEALNRVWQDAKEQLLADVRKALGPEGVLVVNGATPRTMPRVNGDLLEDYVDAVLEGRESWKRVLETYLTRCETAHRPTLTLLSTGSGVNPTFEDLRKPWSDRQSLYDQGRSRTQRMRFGLTTALMGDGYFAFDLSTRDRGQRWWYPEYDAPLGFPTGAAAQGDDGLWRRPFDHGIVLCNPTPGDISVKWDHPYRDVTSGQVVRSLSVPSMDGRILVRHTAPP